MVKICCIGAGYVGGPTMAMIAYQAPAIEVREARKLPLRTFSCVTATRCPLSAPLAAPPPPQARSVRVRGGG